MTHLYKQYAHKAGFDKVGRHIKSGLNKALSYLLREDRVCLDKEGLVEQGLNGTVYLKGAAPVVLRKNANRDIDEIPLRELKKVMDDFEQQHSAPDVEAMFRHVLSFYGRSRLTSKSQERLKAARGLLAAEPPR